MRKKNIYLLAIILIMAFSSFVHAETLYGPASFSATEKNWFSRNYHHLSLQRIQLQAPVEDGRIIIRKQTGEKIKRGLVVFNHRFIPLKRLIKGNESSFEVKVKLKKSNRLFVYFVGEKNASITIELDGGDTAPAPEVVNFSASLDTIDLGQSLDLQWEVENADTVSIDNGIGTVEPAGSLSVSPTESTTYTLTAEGPGGTASAETSITVNIPPPLASISVNPTLIAQGESATLSWTSENAASCSISPDIGEVDLNGSLEITPETTTTYTVTATGAGGTASATVTVSVTEEPVVSISAAPTAISSGESTVLTWSSINIDSANIDNGIGSVDLSGSQTVTPENTTTYTLSCTGSAGTVSTSVTVYVYGSTEDQAEGTFGSQYNDVTPQDATIDAYDEDRFSIITGSVKDISGNPISDVSITVHDHLDYGTAVTDDDGTFSIPVEGGRYLTVIYTKSGYITVHRKIDVGWNGYAITDAVQMLTEDTAETEVVFDGNYDTIITHTATEVTDDFGSRTATMVFIGDNQAYLQDEDGNDVQQLTAFTVRATEFTTQDSMPSELPANSAYTYCTELQADGAERVRFEKAVTVWVDNFLGFDAGSAVPVGYYDRDKAQWVPSDNGIVVRLLDTDYDGTVDALDATGDGVADDLDGSGSYSDEVSGLTDTTRYQPDSTFWRFEVYHFTPWDCNWPYGPPDDATVPNGDEATTDEGCEDEDCTQSNSYVENKKRAFHEDIPVPGTGLTLHYASNRVEGFDGHTVTIPASGDTIPDSLESIIVKLKVAGRTFSEELPAEANQSVEFTWDSLDLLGNRVEGEITGTISIGFVYGAVYYSPGNSFDQAFSQAGDSITAIGARQEVISWKSSKVPFLSEVDTNFGNGWSLSNHHRLIQGDVLYRGNGTTESASARGLNMITTVVGTGSAGYSGDNGPAKEAQLKSLCSVAFDASGNMYIADRGNHVIRKVDTSGIITTVAGTGSAGYSGDNGPATEAQLYYPWNVAFDASGNMYIADWYNDVIRKVDTSGIITTVAGTGSAGYSGDNGPATEAELDNSMDVAFDASGNMYIADYRNHVIRKVDTSGIITTVAGTGSAGYSGDNGPATEAQFNYPTDVAFDASGNMYIADRYNHVIRKVDTSGIITTVAGTGSDGYSGDNGPATEAKFFWPSDVAFDASGNMYIADAYNEVIRKVDTSGIITTVAGTGSYGYAGDNGPATEAKFSHPSGFAFDASGNIYIADWNNHVIRKVQPTPLAEALGLDEGEGEYYVSETDNTAHIFSSAGYHMSTVDMHTGTTLTTFNYDDDNRLTSIADRFGNTITIDRDEDGNPTAITAPFGQKTELTVDGDGNLTDILFEDSSSYGFGYTSDGLMTDMTDPRSLTSTHAFDENGRVISTTDPENGTWTFEKETYDDGSALSTVTSGENNATTHLDTDVSDDSYKSVTTYPGGNTRTYVLENQNLDESVESCSVTTKTTFTIDGKSKQKIPETIVTAMPSGLMNVVSLAKTYQEDDDSFTETATTTIDQNGAATTVESNYLTGTTTVTSPESRTATSIFDPDTLLTTESQVTGLNAIEYDYDDYGRMTSVTSGSRTASYGYNSRGNLESVADPLGRTTSYSYDLLDRVTLIENPDYSVIGFQYDEKGNMTVLTTPVPADNTFEYNGVNKLSSVISPLNSVTTYSYDAERKLTGIGLPSGKTITNTYSYGRLSQTVTDEWTTDYTYGCMDLVSSVTRGSEVLSYGYDGTLITSVSQSGTLNQDIGLEYNDDFRATSITYAGGTETLSYDNDGLLTSSGIFSIGRNTGNGLPESVSDSAFSLTRSFNGFGEVSAYDLSISSSNVFSLTLARNDNGEITGKTETIEGTTADIDYTYDEKGQLLTVTTDGTLAEEYRYDNNGNRTYEMNSLRGIAGRTFSYSDEDHIVTAGTVQYAFDSDDRLSSRTDGSETTEYVYSSTWELMRVALSDGTAIIYTNDPSGRRIAKSVNGTVEEKYLWSGLTTLLAVYDGSGNLYQRFIYADGRMPYAMEMGGCTYYLTYDQVGSLRLVTNSAGNTVKRIDYDTFGNVISDSVESFTVPFGFAGGLHDHDTDLVRFGHRDYMPEIGKWTAKDPILFAGGDTNLYGYVLNNPINYIDPFGLWGVKYGGSLMGIDFSAVAYDSNKGWFPSTKTNIDVSTTVFGGGVQFTFDTPVESRTTPCEDVNVSMGMGKYLGVTYNTELSRGSVNIGLGLGSPISLGTSIQNFTQGLSNSIQRAFN